MAKNHKSRPRWVICVCNDDYPASLELRKVYRTLPDHDAESDGWLRVIDESEEDYLYPADFFRPILLTPSLERTLSKQRRRGPKRRQLSSSG